MDPVYMADDLPVHGSLPRPKEDNSIIGLLILLGVILLLFILGPDVFAQTRLPGTDASDRLEMAGTLLKLADTSLFNWGCKIFSGICIMSSAWALKEQRFGIAIICVVGAIMFGTAATWVRNIFSIGSGNSVFGYVAPIEESPQSGNALSELGVRIANHA